MPVESSNQPGQEPPPEPQFPPGRYEHSEAALGGADAVEKTSYVVGRGAEPERRDPANVKPLSPGGLGPMSWVLLILILAFLAYMVGIFR